MSNIKISVIIPTLNQVNNLALCLPVLKQSKYSPEKFEVLVIDNDSIDGTKELVYDLMKTMENLIYYFCESPGLMAARHMGYMKSEGEILSFIDDDSLVDPNWLEGIEEAFQDKNTVLVGGPCIPEYESEPPAWCNYFWGKNEYGRFNGFLSLIDFGDSPKYISPDYVYGCNYNIRKSIFKKIQGTYPDYLPEELRAYQGAGETGVGWKINKEGQSLYHPKVKINHLVPNKRMTIEYFCWRAYFQGIGNSFLDIRKEIGLDETMKKKPFLHRALVKLKKYIVKSNYSDTPEVDAMRIKISSSRESGYQYHRNELKNNPLLYEWITRTDYLGDNGIIPAKK